MKLKRLGSTSVLLLVLLIGMIGINGCKKDNDLNSVTKEASDVEIDVAQQEAQSVPELEGWELVFSDEFSGNELDASVWSHQEGTGSQFGLDDWGNNEEQSYNPNNVSLEDGFLVIEARKESKGGKEYTSGRITTKDSFSKAFGRFEARISMPVGEGFWPAFWMLPQDEMYGYWAASGEIDIMEARGRFSKKVSGTIHYGSAWPNQENSGTYYQLEEGIDAFHTYALEWEPGEIRWYVDDVLYQTQTKWHSISEGKIDKNPYPAPFDQPFYMLLNLAVGGNYDEGRLPGDEMFPARMVVDYVRVYELTGRPYKEAVIPLEVIDTLSEAAKEPLDNSYIYDTNYEDLITEITSSDQALHEQLWNVVAISDFGGSAFYEVINDDISGLPLMKLDILNKGNQNYSIQLIQQIPLAKNRVYELTFMAKANQAREIKLKIGAGATRGWKMYAADTTYALSETLQEFKLTFKMNDDTDESSRLEFNCGLSEIDVYIGNVVLKDITDL